MENTIFDTLSKEEIFESIRSPPGRAIIYIIDYYSEQTKLPIDYEKLKNAIVGYLEGIYERYLYDEKFVKNMYGYGYYVKKIVNSEWDDYYFFMEPVIMNMMINRLQVTARV